MNKKKKVLNVTAFLRLNTWISLYDYNYPTLVDMNGFNDSSDDLVEELLRIVFFGRLPQEERLMDAVELHRFGL